MLCHLEYLLALAIYIQQFRMQFQAISVSCVLIAVNAECINALTASVYTHSYEGVHQARKEGAYSVKGKP